MSFKWKIRIVALIVAGSLAAFVPANAAHLKVLPRKEVRFIDGTRVPASDMSAAKAPSSLTSRSAPELHSIVEPAHGNASITIITNFQNPVSNAPVTSDSWIGIGTPILIEPDAGEAAGGCALVHYSLGARGHLEGTGAAEAQFGFGGGAATTQSTPTAAITLPDPGTIVLTPSVGSPVTELSYGPSIIGIGDPDVNDLKSGNFTARIGDTVNLQITMAFAENIPVGSTASGDAKYQVYAAARSCAPIPALNLLGLVALALLLAGGGLLLTRRMGS